MELKEFVSETLTQIVAGVSQAQNDVSQKGATVNPKDVVFREGVAIVVVSGPKPITIQNIEFEVSLTETEGNQAGGRIGVFFGSIGVGAHASKDSGSNAINRVKFSIPIALPRFEIK